MDGAILVNHGPHAFDKQLREKCQPTVKRREDLKIPTNVLLPKPCQDDCNTGLQEYLHLPRSFMMSSSVDEYLKSVPQLWSSAQQLFAKPVRQFYSTSQDRLLYVGQGEVAHATASQCDVVASDRATTCHILALRSTMATSANEPLVTVAHIDWTGYHRCIQNMILHHKSHHLSSMDQDVHMQVEESRIEMDVHIVGGFEDSKGSSRKLSNFIVEALTRLAYEEQYSIQMTLKTCAISSMNDTGYNQPIGRGLGVHVQTGEVFLTKVDPSAVGPCQELRSARLWAGANDELLTIHTSVSDNLVIRPFFFRPRKRFGKLLRLNDRQLLPKTSTSPAVEEEDFCDNVRKTFRFLLMVKCSDVFGRGYDNPVVFSRKDDSNLWELAIHKRNKERSVLVIG